MATKKNKNRFKTTKKHSTKKQVFYISSAARLTKYLAAF